MTNEELSGLYQLGGVLVVVAAGGFASLRWVVGKIKDLPLIPTETKREATTIVTADTVAMQQLSGKLEVMHLAVAELTHELVKQTALATEGNALRREATVERRSLREALDLNTEATERSMQKIDALRDEVRDLIKEFVRAQK